MSAAGVREAIQEEAKKDKREIVERYVVVMQNGGATWRVMDMEDKRFISSSHTSRDADHIAEALNSMW